MKDYELAKMSLEELLQPFVEGLPPERRLAGIAPEQRLAGLTPEQRLAGLTPDELAEALEALPPEVREQIKKRLH